MAAFLRNNQDAFDFSLDALEFKQNLWQKLMETNSSSSLQPVDDDDLEWIHAAGNPHLAPDDEQTIQ